MELPPVTPGNQCTCLINAMSIKIVLLFEPAHDKIYKMASALSEDPDQPGHPSSLISLRCPHEESLGP